MKKTILWLQELLISMGNALFHPYKDNSPPSFEAQPFKDDPYKNRGIAQVKVKIVLNFKERFNWASFLLSITRRESNDRTIKNQRMCFNKPMNKQIKKKLSTSNSGVNLKKTDKKQPTWHFEVEGSGQRKRYLRSLKDKAVA